jgi:hypothetical protein
LRVVRLGSLGYQDDYGFLGLVCSVAASLLIRDLLFGVHAWDAPTLGFVVVLLGLAAMVAAFVPARRAASVNPVKLCELNNLAADDRQFLLVAKSLIVYQPRLAPPNNIAVHAP